MEMNERLKDLEKMLNILNKRQQVLNDIKAELETERHIVSTQMDTDDLIQTTVLLKNPFIKLITKKIYSENLSNLLFSESVKKENGRVVEVRDYADFVTDEGHIIMMCSNGVLFNMKAHIDNNLNGFDNLLKAVYLNRKENDPDKKIASNDEKLNTLLNSNDTEQKRADDIKELGICEVYIKDIKNYIKKNEKLIKTLSNEKDKLEQIKRTL
jgi:hypothetical protein